MKTIYTSLFVFVFTLFHFNTEAFHCLNEKLSMDEWTDEETLSVEITYDAGFLIASASVSGLTYQWYKDGELMINATGETYIPHQNALYSLTVSDENDCTATAEYNHEQAYYFDVYTGFVQHITCAYTTGYFTYVATEEGVPPFTTSFESPTGLTEGTHYFSITDANGISAVLEVIVNTVAPWDMELSYAYGEFFVNTGISYYTWELDGSPIPEADGEDTYVPSQNGLYTVSGYDENECLVTASYELKNIGVDELNPLDISLYPNPSTDFIQLETAKHVSKNTVIRISDMEGKQMISLPVESPKIQIDLQNFPVGNYIMEYEYNKQKIYKKFAVQ